MTEDLNMTGDDYNVALFTFFITYILFEVKSNDPRLERTSLTIADEHRFQATSFSRE